MLALAGTLAVLEIVFRVLPTSESLRALPVNADNPVMRFEPGRTVTISRGAAFQPRARKRVNNFGFVNDQDYDPEAGEPLLAVVGDSYVEAVQVEHHHTFHGLLADALRDRARVYSFAASGAPLSSYLAYAAYARDLFQPSDLVVVIVGNDFDESWVEYKRAPGFHYFAEAGDDVELLRVDYQPSRLKSVARRSALVRYLMLNLNVDPHLVLGWLAPDARAAGPDLYAGNTLADADSKRRALGRRAAEIFLERLPAAAGIGAPAITLVVDGVRPQLYTLGTPGGDGTFFGQMRRHLITTAQARGFRVIDLQPRFVGEHQRTGRRLEFESDGHWNVDGHRVVYEALLEGITR